MGIKFKDKTTVGAPVAGDVKTREIVFDLKNNSLYSSTDGTDIVKLGGGDEQGGIIWTNGTDYKVGDIVTEGTTGYVCTVDHIADGSGAVGVDNPADGGTSWSIIQATASEKGGIAHDATSSYVLGDMVTSGGVPYVCTVVPTPNPGTFDPTDWTEIGGVEVGGIAWDPLIGYNEGDIVTDAAGDVWVIGATPPAIGTSPTSADSKEIGAEQGGVLHITVGQDYAVGDTVTLVGSGFQYVCKTAHTSTVACDTAPDDVNWYQPGIPATTYNFTSDLLGTVCGSVPAGPHVVTPPDENGPCYFSVDLGSAAKSATVLLEGFELAPVDYDLTSDGYIKILSPVADNSWLKIII